MAADTPTNENLAPTGDTPRKLPGKRLAAQALREERRTKVKQGLLAGMSVREIAEALQVPKSTVHTDIHLLLKRYRDENTEDIGRKRSLWEMRMERAVGAIHADVGSGNVEAIRELRGIGHFVSRLFGMYAPKVHQVQGPKGGPIQYTNLSDAEIEQAIDSYQQPLAGLPPIPEDDPDDDEPEDDE